MKLILKILINYIKNNTNGFNIIYIKIETNPYIKPLIDKSFITMYTVCCTRFTNNTWEENKNWKEENNYIGCIYNSPTKIKDNVAQSIVIFMVEMNNDLNLITGIGIFKNYVCTDKYYKVYKDGNYNRYTYKGSYRIDRSEFNRKELIYIKILEHLIFKGSYHLKRSDGITQMPSRILNNSHINYINIFKNMFIKKYCKK